MDYRFDDHNERNYQYSEEREKWNRSLHASIWFIVGIVSLCCLAFIVKLNIDDIKVIMNANATVTNIKVGTTLSGMDENGNLVTVVFAKHKSYVNTEYSVENRKSSDMISSGREYAYQKKTAFKDKNDLIHVVSLKLTMIPIINKDKIKIYYYGDDYDNAKALNALWFWVVSYVVLIPFTVICMFRAYRSMYPKSHVPKKA